MPIADRTAAGTHWQLPPHNGTKYQDKHSQEEEKTGILYSGNPPRRESQNPHVTRLKRCNAPAIFRSANTSDALRKGYPLGLDGGNI